MKARKRREPSSSARYLARPAAVRIALFANVRRYLGRATSASPWDSRKPVREELFSVERLEEHSRSLAAAQLVTPKPTKGHPLSGRLSDNGAVLLHA
jgi:cyclic beta-1,2-glucan synthetase